MQKRLRKPLGSLVPLLLFGLSATLNAQSVENCPLKDLVPTATYDEVYDDYFPRIRLFLKRRGVSEADLDDQTQDVFVELVAKGIELKKGGNIGALLFQIAARRNIDKLRKRDRERNHLGRRVSGIEEDAPDVLQQVDSRELTADELLVAKELAENISRITRDLPAKEREAFLLTHIQREGLDQRTKALNATQQQINQLTFSARTKLRRFTKRRGGDVPDEILSAAAGLYQERMETHHTEERELLAHQDPEVREAILQLPASERTAVIHKWILGKSNQEVAQIIGFKPGSEKRVLLRSRRKLLDLMKRPDQGIEAFSKLFIRQKDPSTIEQEQQQQLELQTQLAHQRPEIREAILQLPDIERDVVIQRQILGKSDREIAQSLGLKTGTITVVHRRAKQMLLKLMNQPDLEKKAFTELFNRTKRYTGSEEEQKQLRDQTPEIREAILQLPETARGVVIHKRILRKTDREIAQTFGLKPGSVKSVLVRSRKRILRSLGQPGPRKKPFSDLFKPSKDLYSHDLAEQQHLAAQSAEIREALLQLSKTQRTVAIQKWILGKKHREIAQSIGLKPISINSILQRAKSRLFQLMNLPDRGEEELAKLFKPSKA